MQPRCASYRSAETRGIVGYASERPHDSASKTVIRLATVSPEALVRLIPDELERRVLESRMQLCRTSTDGRMPIAIKYALIRSVDRDPRQWNGLYYEGQLYTKMARQLVMHRWTPHLILPLEVGTCPVGCCSLSREERALYAKLVDQQVTDEEKTLVAAMAPASMPETPGAAPTLSDAERRRLRAEIERISDVQIIMTERSSGTTAYTYFTDARRTLAEVRSVLFQILWTVLQMTRIGAMHNDLHFDNIFVDAVARPFDMYYVIQQNYYYEVPIEAFVRLYDFDWGWMAGGPVNSNHKYQCEDMGICSKYNPKFDAYTVLYFAKRYLAARFPDVNAFVVDVLDPALDYSSRFQGRLCNAVGTIYLDPMHNTCNGPLEPDDQQMHPLDVILRHNFFAPFHRDDMPTPADSATVFYDGTYAQHLPHLRALPFPVGVSGPKDPKDPTTTVASAASAVTAAPLPPLLIPALVAEHQRQRPASLSSISPSPFGDMNQLHPMQGR